MPGLQLLPFAEDSVEDAAALLADRHRRHREAEPLLPAVADFGAEIAALLAKDGASGIVGIRGGRVVAYVLGTRLADETWGPNAWVEFAGHAAEVAEDVRDLYAAAAAEWFDAGRKAHYVWVPAFEQELIEAWFRLGFGQQQALAVREVPEEVDAPPPGVVVRGARADELEVAVALGPTLNRHQALSPVFSRIGVTSDDEEREEWKREVADANAGLLVAEVHGRPVSVFSGVPVDYSSMHTGLARPENACLLGYAATLPEARGSGAGLALTNAIFAWARSQGYDTIVTDWRVTNLLSSRFWPRRGFRTTFLRLHRLIA